MRAAVLEEFGEPLVVQELELAEPKSEEVLVRLVACGVCHTDLYTASGADPSGYAPCVLGHEGAGVVERIGDDVTLQSEALNFIPMMWRDAWEVGNESNDPTIGAAAAAAVAVLGGLGVGFSSYPDKAAKSSGGGSGEGPAWGDDGEGEAPTWDSGGSSEGPVWTP